jgi:hypothetical protein
MDVTQAIKDAKGGAEEFRVEKAASCRPARQGESSRRRHFRQREGLPSTAVSRQAVGRQGQLYEKDFHLFDHGSGREDRCSVGRVVAA